MDFDGLIKEIGTRVSRGSGAVWMDDFFSLLEGIGYDGDIKKLKKNLCPNVNKCSDTHAIMILGAAIGKKLNALEKRVKELEEAKKCSG